MVFNSLLVLSVANKSADVWQYIACFPEHISSDQLVDLVCCLPLQQLGRFALCLWSFFCLPPSPDSYYHSQSYYDSDSDSDSDSSSTISYYHHDGDYDSHSN